MVVISATNLLLFIYKTTWEYTKNKTKINTKHSGVRKFTL